MRRPNSFLRFCFLIFVLLNSFESLAQLPPSPILRPKIHLTERPDPTKPVQSTHVVIPNLHFTIDGRVGLNPEPSFNGFEFNLMVPERLRSHVMEEQPGSSILKTTIWKSVDIRAANGIFPGEYFDHATLCDATQMSNPDPTEILESNPKVCAEKNKDCYDFKVIYAVGLTNGNRQLRSVPIRVRVANPKTSDAEIEAVWVTGAMVRGQTFPGISRLMELNTVGVDKKLLVMRTLDSTITWRNTNNNLKKTEKRDMVYSTYEGRKGPCDVTGWREVHPITHAPFDSRMKNRYGFARTPFRDAIGNKIPDGAEIFGAYQWVDRDAKNIFFGSNNVRFTNWVNNRVETAFDYECQVEGCEPSSKEQVESFEERGRAKSYAALGLWTNGKIVQLDSMFNGSDFAVGFLPKYHIKMHLYEHDQGKTNGYVRIGGQRQNSGGDSQVPGLVRNASFFGSYENSFNFLTNIMPRTPADVVWHMGTSNMTDEIAFDDYMNPNILISSPMNAASSIGGRGRRKFYDGRQFVKDAIDPNNNKKLVQNSSTSTDLNTPKYGELNGNTRIEPVALGGIKGKGVYLDGADESKIIYYVPNQSFAAENETWNYSLFVDPRFNTSTQAVRNLVEFSNGSKIQLFRGNQFRFEFNSDEIYYHTFPSALRAKRRNWIHFGFKVSPAREIKDKNFDYAQVITVFINGFPYKSLNYKTNNPMGNPEGSLVVGHKLQAWIDDFKVIVGEMNFEQRCNLARGSLIRLDESYAGNYRNISGQFHGGIHSAIAYEVGEYTRETDRAGVARIVDRFACHTNYRSWKGINVNMPPAGTISVRHKILFPEGPLVHNQSRPDSSRNGFCLSCHTTAHPVASMNTSALVEDPALTAEEDLRRQPMQPQRLIYGNFPANYFGPGLPNKHRRSSRRGLLIDQWVTNGD